MNVENKMVPVTLMIDLHRHQKLKTASKSTRISMSELVRIAVDRLMFLIGDPQRPNAKALARLLNDLDGEEGVKPKTASGRRRTGKT